MKKVITRNDIDPPRYDWRYFLDCEDSLNADTLIKDLKEPRKIHSATRIHGRSLDLSHLRDEIAKLLAEVHEQYEADLDEWHQRNTAEEPRPKRKLADNWEPGVPATTHDYSKYENPLSQSEHEAEWEAWWKEAYGRGPGRPKKSKTRRGLPTGPMDGPYFTIQSWWDRNVKRSFNPDYNFGKKTTKDTEDRRDWRYFNQSGRLLLMIAQDLDYHYTPAVCNSLNHRLRKLRWHKPTEQ